MGCRTPDNTLLYTFNRPTEVKNRPILGGERIFMDTVERLADQYCRIIRRNVSLADYTTFGIGGPAELLAEADSADVLTAIVRDCRSAGLPVTVMGEGSNVLCSDRGIDGLVVINRCRRLWQDGRKVIAEAGVRLGDLIDFAICSGLAGLEQMAGIPGTVGGAVIGNAGAYGQSIAEKLAQVILLDESGAVFQQGPGELGFGYRTSRLKSSPDVVLRADFLLGDGIPERLRQCADEIIALREAKLPVKEKCAGSYFKNIEDPTAPYGKVAAGKLLEEAGAKSFCVGQAAVSEKHANVIVNRGGARAADVLLLADKMKTAVRAKFGIELEEEVRFLGTPMGRET